jgi:hypothetical protein
VSLLDALRGVLEDGRTQDGAVRLEEQGKGNKCEPIEVVHGEPFLAVRLTDSDHLRLFRGSKDDRTPSFRSLPDYLVFSAPRAQKKGKQSREPALQVLICELKSSEAGVDDGKRQVQLGRFFAEYLVRVAAYSLGEKEPPPVDYRGAVARPMPEAIKPKGRLRPGATAYDYEVDAVSDMMIFKLPGGEALNLENVFWR